MDGYISLATLGRGIALDTEAPLGGTVESAEMRATIALNVEMGR